jgi:hypothetical protein
VAIDRQLDRIKRKRMRHAERKLKEAQGNGCGLNAAFCIGQGLLLTSNTNGRVLFSHLCGLKKTRSSNRGAARKACGVGKVTHKQRRRVEALQMSSNHCWDPVNHDAGSSRRVVPS